MSAPQSPSVAKQALLALDKLQSRIDAYERAAKEPIAIIGVGLRFPGGAVDRDTYWKLLEEGADAITTVPADRWSADALFDADPEAAGKINSRWGGFIEGIDRFDAHFFGISPREARSMDPQQRVLLEVAWEALEDAGIVPERLAGSQTGVFVGITTSDYLQLQASLADVGDVNAYTHHGSALNAAAGRLSYTLGLHGPSLAVDTACSSSLVAIHLACQSLRNRECSAAMAGGVNLLVSPLTSVRLAKSRLLAPDGRCKTFDAAADGYVRSEGCGLVVLKRLSDAVRDGDQVLAVIRSSAVNQDGRSSSLTVPNGLAQTALIREALRRGDVDPADVDYVEAHGTGTSLGDPIEVEAIANALARPTDRPVLIGSVKANIGHLESASGVAGLIKVALALHHGRVPGQIHFHVPNPHLSWADLAVSVPTSPRDWPGGGAKRIAGISAFGASGTNAHAVLEDARMAVAPQTAPERAHNVLVLSAATDGALRSLAGRYRQRLESDARLSLTDVCFSAATTRAQLPVRVGLVGTTAAAICEQLSAVERGEIAGRIHGTVAASTKPRVAFLFTGQGSQYAGMAAGLRESEPAFRRAFDECCELFRPHLGRDLRSTLDSHAAAVTSIDETAYAQPVLFAVEHALSVLLRSWGVVPDMVLGHSVGELAAACVAGAVELEDAVTLVANRGRLMQALPSGGAMASVVASLDRVQAAIAAHAPGIAVAAINSPMEVTVSGIRAEMDVLLAALGRQGIATQTLRVSHAFHSPLMDPMLDEFERVAQKIRSQAPAVPIASNVTGLVTREAPDAAYWRRHVRGTVQFAAGMRSLYDAGCRVFVEIGPAPTLTRLGASTIDDPAVGWIPTLRRGHEDGSQMAEALAQFHVRGLPVDWTAVHGGGRQHVALPHYAFERERFWIEGAEPTRLLSASGRAPAPAMFSDPSIDDATSEWLYDLTWELEHSASGPAFEPAITPSMLESAVGDLIPQLESTHHLGEFRRLVGELNPVCGAIAVAALQELGVELSAGASFEGSALAERCRVAPQHRRLFGRMLEILMEDGVLRRAAAIDQWDVVRAPQRLSWSATLAGLEAAHPDSKALLRLLARCGERLAAALRNDIDPLALLFPTGETTDLESFYTDSPFARYYNELIRGVVGKLVASQPEGRVLRVLEVGGGTGSTTSVLLPGFDPRRTEYTFTDVSPSFTAEARRRYAAVPFVRCKTLDIESDPIAQGFAPYGYDIVIAANVLHATRSLRDTVTHVRELLAHGGQIVFLEGTGPSRWLDLTFGLTEGWWRFDDRDLRPAHALISAERWVSLLGQLGFRDPQTVPAIEHGQGDAWQVAVLAGAPDQPPAGVAQASKTAIDCLILADEDGVGDRLAHLVRSAGGRAIVTRSTGLQDALGDRAIRQVIDLRSLSRARAGEDPHDAAIRTCAPALDLVKAMDAVRSQARLWIATRGAQSVRNGSDLCDIIAACLWGLGRVISLERPDTWGGLIDLDPAGDTNDAAVRLFETFSQTNDEDQIVCRGARRYVARLTPGETVGRDSARFRSNAAYLISGGLGRLGLMIAQWMAERGAGHLVLVGRRGLPPRTEWDDVAPSGATYERIRSVQRIERAGAQVVVVAADAADPAAMTPLFARFGTRLPELRGIVHAAADLQERSLEEMTAADMSAVFRPKIAAAALLDRLSRQKPLDWFVLFSSGASVWGSRHLAHHAAACQYLDALAHERRAAGLPGTTINWGWWAGGNTTEEEDRFFEGTGLRRMNPAHALDVFGRLLALNVPQKIVSAFDWSTFKPIYESSRRRPLLDAIQVTPRAAASVEEAPPGFLRRIDEARAKDRWPLLVAHVHDQVVDVLGFDRGRRVDIREGFFRMGMDSIMTIQLRNRLATALGVPLPPTLAFECPTIEAVARFVAHEALHWPREDSPSASAADAAPPEDDLSEDSLALLLAQKLDQLR